MINFCQFICKQYINGLDVTSNMKTRLITSSQSLTDEYAIDSVPGMISRRIHPATTDEGVMEEFGISVRYLDKVKKMTGVKSKNGKMALDIKIHKHKLMVNSNYTITTDQLWRELCNSGYQVGQTTVRNMKKLLMPPPPGQDQ